MKHSPHKACSRCGQEKPRTRDFFYRRTESADGLQSICRACQRAANTRYHERARTRGNRLASIRELAEKALTDPTEVTSALLGILELSMETTDA